MLFTEKYSLKHLLNCVVKVIGTLSGYSISGIFGKYKYFDDIFLVIYLLFFIDITPKFHFMLHFCGILEVLIKYLIILSYLN